MHIPILIEPIEGDRFRARVGEPFALSAEGGTREEARSRLEELLAARLANGATLATISVPASAPLAGNLPFPADDLYRTDWVYRELQEAIAENRQIEEAADS